jgi:hypothetical protein
LACEFPFSATPALFVCATGPFVCPWAACTVIASPGIKQNAKILNSFMSFLRPLNILNGSWLQVSAEDALRVNVQGETPMDFGA